MQPYSLSFQDSVKLTKTIENVLSKIDSLTLTKIDEYTVIPIRTLISPKKKSRKGDIPRPQNSFVIYRRNIMEGLKRQHGHKVSSNLRLVSGKAGKWWSSETPEIKFIYQLIAELAREVHKIMYPNYVFKPKKKKTSPNPSNQDFDHDQDNFPSNQSSPLHYQTGNPFVTYEPQNTQNTQNTIQNTQNIATQLPSISSLLSSTENYDNYDRRMCSVLSGP